MKSLNFEIPAETFLSVECLRTHGFRKLLIQKSPEGKVCGKFVEKKGKSVLYRR